MHSIRKTAAALTIAILGASVGTSVTQTVPAEAAEFVFAVTDGIGEDPKALATSPDGSMVFVAGANTMQIIDTSDFSVRTGVSFNPNGHRLTAMAIDGVQINLYGITDGNLAQRPLSAGPDLGYDVINLNGTTYSIAGDPNAEAVYALVDTGDGDYELVWTDMGTFNTQTLTHWDTTLDPTQSLAISPDGSTAFVVLPGFFSDSELLSFDIATGTVLNTATLDGTSSSLALSPDGQTLAISASLQNTLFQVTNLYGNTFDITSSDGYNSPHELAFSRDGTALFVRGDSTVLQYSNGPDGFSYVTALTTSTSSPHGLVVTPNLNQLFISSDTDDGIVDAFQLPIITPATQSITAQVGVPFASTELETAGWNAPGSPPFSIISGTLPSGVTFDSGTGIVSGTLTAVAPPITLVVQGSLEGESVSATITIVSDPAATVTPSTQAARVWVESAYQSQALTATNFTAPPSYSVSPTLPAGLSLNTSTGVISGTPTVASAEQEYIITATNGAETAAVTLELSVPPVLNPGTQQLASTVQSFVTTHLPDPIGFSDHPTFSVTPDLPEGLSLNSETGVISGTVTTAVRKWVHVKAISGGLTATEAVLINLAPKFDQTATVFGAVVGQSFSQVIGQALGFPGAVNYTVTPALPTGLSINAEGRLVGTPTGAESGPANYTVVARSGRWSDVFSLNLTVLGAPAPNPNPNPPSPSPRPQPSPQPTGDPTATPTSTPSAPANVTASPRPPSTAPAEAAQNRGTVESASGAVWAAVLGSLLAAGVLGAAVSVVIRRARR